MLKKVFDVLTTVLVVVTVVAAVLLVGLRLVGFKPFSVLSGSMTPTYKVGSLVYVRSVDPSEVKVGDAITFVAGSDNTVVTHRVQRIDTEQGCFYTKGDANNDMDYAPVYYENLLGRVAFSIPLIGYISTYISTQQGKILLVVFFAVLLLLMFAPSIVKAFKKHND